MARVRSIPLTIARWTSIVLHPFAATIVMVLGVAVAHGVLMVLVLMYRPGSFLVRGAAAAAPVLAWSRLVLERHQAIEVVSGAAVGFVFGYALIAL